MSVVLEKIKLADCKKFQFEEYDEGVAIVTNLDGVFVFVQYIENEDCFVVFDGGYTTTECLDSFGDSDEIVEKMKKALTKYKVNKVDESLYMEANYQTLEKTIEILVATEKEILY